MSSGLRGSGGVLENKVLLPAPIFSQWRSKKTGLGNTMSIFNIQAVNMEDCGAMEELPNRKDQFSNTLKRY